ncbi:hypothetical protein CYMTET_10143 [Cymbomonas tetramitiformis]|uniref:Uncharacterized protein n=1 Tax=Cymbomonas tetramitiformis TaxID=36881 RepID=A0AAE0LE49_9CHLO|nr:hypothetical protein CYMTET_10143 [Cymbomonas tetramitiformis]
MSGQLLYVVLSIATVVPLVRAQEPACTEERLEWFYKCAALNYTRPWIYFKSDHSENLLDGDLRDIQRIVNLGDMEAQRSGRIHRLLEHAYPSTWLADDADAAALKKFMADTQRGSTPPVPPLPRCGTVAAPKRAAIILRGESFRVGGVGDHYQADSLDNYNEYLVKSLQQKGYEVNIFVFLYRTENFNYDKTWKLFSDKLQPKLVTLVEVEDSRQAHMNIVSLVIFTNYCLAVNKVYDFVIYTRYDLLFKTPVLDMPDVRVDRFNFAWKEILGKWRQEQHIKSWKDVSGTTAKPDTFHAFHGAFTPCFLHAYGKEHVVAGANFMHSVYPNLKNTIGDENIGHLIDSYFDSNTEHGPLANPLYDLQRFVVTDRNHATEWWTDSCNSLSDFTKDSESGSYCCPLGTYCCPFTIRDCGNASGSEVKRSVKKNCVPKAPGENSGTSPADYVTCTLA